MNDRTRKFLPLICASLSLSASLLVGDALAQAVLRTPQTDKVSRGIDAAVHGQVEEADRFFREATEETPGIFPPGLTAAAQIAKAPYSDGQFAKVRFWIEKTAVDYPDDPEAFLILADIAIQEKRLVEATLLLRHAEQLIAKIDDSTAVTDLPADTSPNTPASTTDTPGSDNAEEKSVQNDATPSANASKSVEPADVRKKRLSGRVRIQWVAIAESRRDWAKAAELLEAILAEWPEHRELNLRLGRDLFKSGQRDKGIETLYRAADATDSNNDVISEDASNDQGDEILSLITSLYEQEGLFEEARDFLSRSLEKEPGNLRLLLQAADMNIRWNRLDEARALTDRAAELAPNDILVRRTRGILALYAGEYREAENLLSQVNDLHPGDAATISALVTSLCEQDDPLKLRKAQLLASKYFRDRPELMDAAATLAMVYLWRGENILARRLLEAKFEENLLGAAGAFFMAVVLERDGQIDDAIRFLKSCLDTETNFPQRTEAEKMLKRLEEQLQEQNEANPRAD